MSKRLMRRPSPATVIASIALFISLGGVSYGLATGSVDSREIKNNNVRSRDIRNNDVRGRDIRTGTVLGGDVGDNSLTGSDVLESSLGTVPTASNAGVAGSAGIAQTARSVSAGAIRAGSLAGITVRSASVVVPGATAENSAYVSRAATARCAAGERLLSGGARWDSESDTDEQWIMSSRRAPATATLNEGWAARGGTDIAADRTLTVEAYCLSG